jgi:hypothetical protein
MWLHVDDLPMGKTLAVLRQREQMYSSDCVVVALCWNGVTHVNRLNAIETPNSVPLPL